MGSFPVKSGLVMTAATVHPGGGVIVSKNSVIGELNKHLNPVYLKKKKKKSVSCHFELVI